MAQKLSRNKRKVIGIRIKPKEGMWINYQLRLRGITHQKLADQLGLKRESVTKIVTGARHSTRVETALYQTLGYHSFEAMIAASRGKGAV
jgi:CRP-like cAMP-binding protein